MHLIQDLVTGTRYIIYASLRIVWITLTILFVGEMHVECPLKFSVSLQYYLSFTVSEAPSDSLFSRKGGDFWIQPLHQQMHTAKAPCDLLGLSSLLFAALSYQNFMAGCKSSRGPDS